MATDDVPQPPPLNPDEAWPDIHRDGADLLRRVHEAVIEGAHACEREALAHPENQELRSMGPLVAYTHDVLRGVIGAWVEMSLVGVTSGARSLFEALLIAEDVSADRSLAKRFYVFGHVVQLVHGTKDATDTEAERQAARDEIIRSYPDWVYADKKGQTQVRDDWRADGRTIADRANAHEHWRGWYDLLYRGASAYVHPTATLGVLAIGDTSFLRQLMGQRAPLAGLLALNIVLLISETHGVDWKDGGHCSRLINELELLTSRSDALYERMKVARG